MTLTPKKQPSISHLTKILKKRDENGLIGTSGEGLLSRGAINVYRDADVVTNSMRIDYSDIPMSLEQTDYFVTHKVDLTDEKRARDVTLWKSAR